MSAVAKRFVFGMPAPAQADGGAPSEPERFPFSVYYFKVSLDPDRTVVENDNFRRHQN
jgi:hypothetical protein